MASYENSFSAWKVWNHVHQQAAPHTVVPLTEVGEGVSRRGCERPDGEGVVHEFALDTTRRRRLRY